MENHFGHLTNRRTTRATGVFFWLLFKGAKTNNVLLLWIWFDYL
ncbi:hypothetical protein [Aquimarina macrocephali]|nr:hypothetical protein [Aquimarina macrocephali]